MPRRLIEYGIKVMSRFVTSDLSDFPKMYEIRENNTDNEWYVKLTSNSFIRWMHGNHIVFKTAPEANWLATQWWVRRDFAVIMILYDNTSAVNSV